jgi:hypothetical protein
MPIKDIFQHFNISTSSTGRNAIMASQRVGDTAKEWSTKRNVLQVITSFSDKFTKLTIADDMAST